MIETIEIECLIRHLIGPSAFFRLIVIGSNDRLYFKQIIDQSNFQSTLVNSFD
jgi:hypothetical protein